MPNYQLIGLRYSVKIGIYLRLIGSRQVRMHTKEDQ